MLLAILFVAAAVSMSDRGATAQTPPPTTNRAAIAGRIVTATGEPVPSIVVSALKQRADAADGMIAHTAAMTQTNERGEFRLADLSDGNYLVVATPPPPQFGYPPRPSGAPVTLLTYYPGTTDAAAAQIIPLASGEIVESVQFSIASTPGYNVSGVVLDENGSPLRNVMVTLLIDAFNGGISSPAVGRSDDQGMFLLSGVVPGSYRLLAGTPTMTTTREGSMTVAGVVGGERAATGGVFVGGRGTASPGVGSVGVGGILPPGGIAAPALAATMFSQPIDVVIGHGDLDGLKLVVVSRK